MKNLKAAFTLFCVVLLISGCSNQAANVGLRYFDTVEDNGDEIRLTILYPTAYPINSLIKLNEIGFFSPENLVVVGVFHARERTEYDKSIAMVKDKGLDWIRFHRVDGDIRRDNLFQKNPLSVEFRKIFEKSDGIIFFGGADIPPILYGEKTELLTSIRTPFRHFLELSFAFHLLGGYQDPQFKPLLSEAPDFPVLGICLGEQTLNVGTGGTMIQDVWSEVYGAKFVEDVIDLPRDNWHTNPYARLYPEKRLFGYFLHPIKLAAEGFFVKTLGFDRGAAPLILSAHHQAADRTGLGFRVAATSLDGQVVEAIHHDTYPNVLGIQFHPEFPVLYDGDETFRMTPIDEKEVSALSILEENPPSYEFHRAIWKWLEGKLTAFHSLR